MNLTVVTFESVWPELMFKILLLLTNLNKI
jgi:hypothetical protein